MIKPTPLALLHKPLTKDLTQTLCYGTNNYSRADFERCQSAWYQTFAQQASTRIALYQHSAFEFVCALSALWQLGKSAIIPANNQANTIHQLKKVTDCFAGDFPGIDCLKANNADINSTQLANVVKANIEPDSKREAITVFTSGTSGEPLPISKSFGQLDAEIIALEKTFGSALGSATISGTVSHHHIYGLLFRVLWPLSCNRSFVEYERDYCEALAVDSLDHSNIVFVMSPAHLSRLPENLDQNAFKASCRAVFSSGAPLDLASAQAATALFGQTPLEIFGSSETGGIASRQQTRSALWQTLPLVNVKCEGLEHQQVLCIQSPHLPDNNWFISADQCTQMNDQGFALGPRADRIAKIGGKRISLCALEQQLLSHPWVDDVRVITLEDRSNRSAAVVVLNSEGNNALINQGKLAINQTLAKHLHSRAERIAIPRYFRYWSSIPLNAQGKTTRADIAALFDNQNKTEWPDLRKETGEQHQRTLSLFIPHNLSWFDGHFPGRPILPGVIQTHWANHYGRQVFGELGDFSQLEVIKFQQVISPGKSIQLDLSWNPVSAKLTFAYNLGEEKFSSGRIVFQRRNEQVST